MNIERVSHAEGLKLLGKRKRRSKYHAQPTRVFGTRFASKREAAEYAKLLKLFMAGLIAELEPHPVYPLHAPNGEVIGKYIADFRFKQDGQVRVIDVKGMKTLPLAKWKQKHLRLEYGIVVEEQR